MESEKRPPTQHMPTLEERMWGHPKRPLTVDELRAWRLVLLRQMKLANAWTDRLQRRNEREVYELVRAASAALVAVHVWIAKQPGVMPPFESAVDLAGPNNHNKSALG